MDYLIITRSWITDGTCHALSCCNCIYCLWARGIFPRGLWTYFRFSFILVDELEVCFRASCRYTFWVLYKLLMSSRFISDDPWLFLSLTISLFSPTWTSSCIVMVVVIVVFHDTWFVFVDYWRLLHIPLDLSLHLVYVSILI